MRLTELYTYRNAEDFICSDFVLINKGGDDYDDAIQKLGQLEDIEEELGIDLLTLFKALKNGIWTKGGYYSDQLEKEPVFVRKPEIGLCMLYDECDENYETTFHDENVACIYTYDYEIMVRQTRLKDYGKTWALTKEELEK